jgi:hypothetical protein
MTEDSLDKGFFDCRFQNTTAKEREIMMAMINVGKGPRYRIVDVAKALSKNTKQFRSSIYKNLHPSGSIAATPYSRPEFLEFTVPHFDQFLQRNCNKQPKL